MNWCFCSSSPFLSPCLTFSPFSLSPFLSLFSPSLSYLFSLSLSLCLISLSLSRFLSLSLSVSLPFSLPLSLSLPFPLSPFCISSFLSRCLFLSLYVILQSVIKSLCVCWFYLFCLHLTLRSPVLLPAYMTVCLYLLLSSSLSFYPYA